MKQPCKHWQVSNNIFQMLFTRYLLLHPLHDFQSLLGALHTSISSRFHFGNVSAPDTGAIEIPFNNERPLFSGKCLSFCSLPGSLGTGCTSTPVRRTTMTASLKENMIWNVWLRQMRMGRKRGMEHDRFLRLNDKFSALFAPLLKPLLSKNPILNLKRLHLRFSLSPQVRVALFKLNLTPRTRMNLGYICQESQRMTCTTRSLLLLSEYLRPLRIT